MSTCGRWYKDFLHCVFHLSRLGSELPVLALFADSFAWNWTALQCAYKRSVIPSYALKWLLQNSGSFSVLLIRHRKRWAQFHQMLICNIAFRRSICTILSLRSTSIPVRLKILDIPFILTLRDHSSKPLPATAGFMSYLSSAQRDCNL